MAVFSCIFYGLLALFLVYLLLLRCKRRLRRWPLLTQYRYAHRGLHDMAAGVPENSLSAFRRAVEAGYGAELDVRLTRDGHLAVVHDSDLTRLCGVAKSVEDLTAAELQALRLCGTTEHIPLLEQVLPLFEGRQPLVIEMKIRRNSVQLVDALCAALEPYGGDYCIECFDPWALYVLRLRRPNCIRGQLSKHFSGDRSVHPLLGFLAGNLLFNWLSKPDFIAYRFADRNNCSLRLCRKLYRVQEFSWTITDAQQQKAAEDDGSVIIFEGFLPR